LKEGSPVEEQLETALWCSLQAHSSLEPSVSEYWERSIIKYWIAFWMLSMFLFAVRKKVYFYFTRKCQRYVQLKYLQPSFLSRCLMWKNHFLNYFVIGASPHGRVGFLHSWIHFLDILTLKKKSLKLIGSTHVEEK